MNENVTKMTHLQIQCNKNSYRSNKQRSQFMANWLNVSSKN